MWAPPRLHACVFHQDAAISQGAYFHRILELWSRKGIVRPSSPPHPCLRQESKQSRADRQRSSVPGNPSSARVLLPSAPFQVLPLSRSNRSLCRGSQAAWPPPNVSLSRLPRSPATTWWSGSPSTSSASTMSVAAPPARTACATLWLPMPGSAPRKAAQWPGGTRASAVSFPDPSAGCRPFRGNRGWQGSSPGDRGGGGVATQAQAAQGGPGPERRDFSSLPTAVKCSGGQVYRECAPACRTTCAELRTEALGSCRELEQVCVAGCNCPEGLVLDDGGQCVQPALCPCTHQGEARPPGSKVQKNCNTW